MSFNKSLLTSIFSDLISQDFDHEVARLRAIYDHKYETRKSYGFDSALDNERLEDEWRFKYIGLEKRRNWLWFLMKSHRFCELDDYFKTDYTFADMDLRLRIDYDIQCKKELDRFKYINRRSSFIPFSKSNLHVDDFDIPEVVIDDDFSSVTYSKVKRAKSYEALIDNNRIYNKCEVDNRDYNLLYEYALKLLNKIKMLQNSRLKNTVIKMFRRVRSVEDIEMQPLKYQSGGFETPVTITSDVDPVRDMVEDDNRPKCCVYCPVIVCMTCFKGEGCCECPRVSYQGNVEQDVGGDTSVVQIHKAENVVLTETEITQSDQTALSNPQWGPLVSSDVISNMNTLVNRWFRIGTYSWTTAHLRGATIISLDLPRVAIFAGESTCEQPNRIPFRIHRYWRGDMTVKIHINCNKFQVGQLQCSWYYQPKADASFASKNNIYTRSGTHHCVISAAPNNEVDFKIPYKAYKSMYHTKTYSGDSRDLPLDLGTLFVTVLSPLKTTGETSPKCSFTVFVKFENNEFTGMIAGNVDAPPALEEPLQYQMDVASLVSNAVPLVEKLLVGSSNDNNRDNPPLNRAPDYFVPTASHSWSIGTDLVEPVHNLRLSGRAQTQHPDVDIDEMKINVLKRKYMICDIFSWSQQDINGRQLWSLPVNPIPPKSRIPVVSPAGTNTLASYQLTPIGFLSSLHQYWRGSIEYRFDIVASQFHSGKLLLAYIPGLEEGAEVTIAQARASPNIIISLDNAMSYTWRIPYVADRPWWPRRYAGESVSNNVSSPSKIFVFVLNELVMADTVSDTVEIIVYMRGGLDMEFAIPVQPSIGLGYDRSYVSSRDDTTVFPVSTTNTFYSGNWHSAPLVQVWRHAPTSEAVGRFSVPITDRPVYYKIASAYPRANIAGPSPSIVLRDIQHCIFLRGVGFSEFIGLPIYSTSVTPSQNRLEECARLAFENNYTYGPWVTQVQITTPNTVTETGYGFIPADYLTTSNTYGGGKSIPFTAVEVSPTLEELEFQGNREESLALVDNTMSLRSTGAGMMTYGERFIDLKDLCRRYQIYGWTSVPATQIERDPGACSFLFPVLPQGLNLAINTPSAVNQIWNRAREGHIPLIASLYRFYRGSLRVRIVISNAQGLIVWIQHRPDRKLDRDVITPCTQVTTAEAVFNHTYGLYMQAIDVNNVVEIEVPFYQMSNFGLLQRPQIVESPTTTDWSRFYSLGEISVGFFGTQPSADVRCTIYYSLADDCRFSTYQGVPPMVIIDDLPEYQGNFVMNLFKTSPQEVGSQVAEGAMGHVNENIQGMLDTFLESFKNKLGETYSCVADSLSSLELSSKIMHISSQILHAINNPSGSTIAISIISILVTFGIMTYSVYNIAHKYITDIWQWIVNKVTSNKVRDEAVDAGEELSYQNETDNAISGFLSLICGGLCTLFGLKHAVKYKPMSKILFNEISAGMKMSNVCFVFFRNFLAVLSDMKAYIVAHLYPGFNAAEALMEGKDIIEKWATHSLHICDPKVSQNIKYNRTLHCQLIDCYAFGKILKVKALETQYPAVIQLINSTFEKLHKIYVELVAQGIDPHVRKMPFVIYNSGAPEIGKSHLTTRLCTELCKSQEIVSDTELMCVLNATSKFWDNCDRQPCLVMDDAFNIRKGTMLEDQIASIFNVVSPVVLVPPKAAVEDKGRRYNPEIFILNSNVPFFRTELCIEEALWRRRDILILSELDPEFKKEGCIHCSNNLPINAQLPVAAIESLKDFHHLRFKYTFNVKNPNCEYLPANTYLKFDELLTLLKKIFKENREAENYKFAERVERCNEVQAIPQNLVGNVQNLEQLWNDAMMSRKAAIDLVQNTTLTTLSQSFTTSVLNEWSECKHKIFKKIYSVVKPGRNKYELINPTCTECVRIKYQCISCNIRMTNVLQNCSVNSVPSTSSSSIEELFTDEKLTFQSDSNPIVEHPDDTVAVPRFDHDIKYHLSSNGTEWFDELPKLYPSEFLNAFKQFLHRNQSALVVKLRSYPRYSRNGILLKNLCESLCSCLHNVNVNPPIVHKGKFAFINPATPHEPQLISGLRCCSGCYMSLPWKVHEVAISCFKLSGHTESWMGDLCDRRVVFDKISFDSIFSKMTKFVFDFYYNVMKPAAKICFSFLSSLRGWCYGLSFLSLLFSTVIMGVGAHEAIKDGSVVDARHEARQNNSTQMSQQQQALLFQANSYESGKPRVVKATKAKVKTPTRMKKDLEYQSVQQFDVVQQRLKTNMASIDVVYVDFEGQTKRVRNYGLMLRDQLMLVQKHYFDFWKRLDISTKFYFVNSSIPNLPDTGLLLNNFFDLEIDWFMTPGKEFFDSNFGILHLPRIVPAFKDITKFIAKSSDHEYIKFDECHLFSSLTGNSMHCIMNVESDKQVTDSNGWLRLSECYSYKYTQKGLCGSALLCSTLERPIIGIHFAGTNVYGYAEPICYESFNECANNTYDYESCDFKLEDCDTARVNFDTLLYPQGTVPNNFSHHQGSVSQYVPSLVHGIVEVDTEPNPLSPKDDRLPPNNPPLKKGVEHMGKPPIDFETSLLNAACEDLKQVILKHVKPIRINIDKLSLQDAVCGNVNVKGFEPLEWSSSEGFPLKSLRPKGVKGKKWLFDLELTESGFVLQGMHGELKRQLIICEELRKKGIRCPTIFVDCLKDTCIDIKKCSIPGKTRIFSISPVQYTIAFKQYFGDFMASYQEARIQAEHGIGINVDSLEWSRIADYITTYGDCIVAGDYKNYGPSLMLSCVEKAFDVIMAWYERYDNNAERQLVRRVLLSEMLHAQHLCLNVVYGVPCGIPSGSPITTPLNSLVNSLYLRCGWLSITQENCSVMHDNIKIITYGDDVCVNVSEKYKDIYNTETLSIFFKKYNIIFTDVDKTDTIVKYRNLASVSFLKRNFKLHPHSSSIFLAPIEQQSIRKCINWMTRKGDPVGNTLENCKQACELAFGHGPKYYNRMREFLQHECLKRVGNTFTSPSWYEKSEICYGI